MRNIRFKIELCIFLYIIYIEYKYNYKSIKKEGNSKRKFDTYISIKMYPRHSIICLYDLNSFY